METYPLDIDPEQVARWIKAEGAVVPSAFRITARRNREVHELPFAKETHLGDQEREDLSEIATIATLEIAPVHASEGWLISVVVEDELGPRISEGATGEPTEQTIDPGTFYKEFIRSGRGNATVIAEVQDAAAMARVNRLIKTIDANRHGANPRKSDG